MKDLNIITSVMMADGIGRTGIGLANLLMNDLDICTTLVPPVLFDNITDLKLIKTLKTLPEKAKIDLWAYILGIKEGDGILHRHESLNADIKIAYSMIEASAIPKIWTDTLNKYYDMVVVPDPFLINVYKSSGVKIPVFDLPLGIILNEQYTNYKHTQNKDFTFGMTGSFVGRKNHIKLMKAFLENFKNKKNVNLQIHGRFGPNRDQIISEYNKLGKPSNIDVLYNPMNSQDYTKFMQKLDCYVFISKGEGYSITPREMISMGKPVILSNNTAHKTICDTGYVVPVKADIKTPAFYEIFNQTLGNNFDCETKDVAKAMEDVYTNYPKYLAKAELGRDWAKKSTWESLKSRYMSLLKPTNIVHGNKNDIREDCLEIADQDLYNKFMKTFKGDQ